MNEQGWIKLYRNIMDHWTAKDKPYNFFAALCYLFLIANHKDNKILFDGKPLIVKRGSFVTSISKLSEVFGWSTKKTRNFLRNLKVDGTITIESTTRGTTITIVNYDVYQIRGQTEELQKEQQENSLGTTKELLGNTNKNEKNDKNEKNNIRVSKDTLCQTDVRRAVEKWNELSSFGIKPVTKVNSGSKRYDSLCARIREYGIDTVIAAIERIKNSDFLKGKNNRNWIITFDWLVKPSNFPKVLEGNYDNSGGENSARDSGTDQTDSETCREFWDNIRTL